MGSEHALYAAVLADPDDEVPRRALAAHYDAAGDPRGQFIRLQLRLAVRAAAGVRDGELLAEQRRLVREHGRSWAAPVADLVAGYAFQRGFIGEVTLPLDRFIDVAPTLFATAPVQHLNLTRPRTRLAALLRSPHLARLTSLALDDLGLDDHDAVLIAGAEALRAVRYLSLSFNGIGRAGVEALAASPFLADLAVLDLTRNPCDPIPRPGGYDLDGRVTAIERPRLADELESRFGPRPWLASPEDPDAWPLPRDAYRIG